MARNTASKGSKLKTILLNSLIAIVVTIILIIALIFGLRHYTEHGQEVVVPHVANLYLEEAKIIAASEGLHIEVIDSTYSTKTPLGTIVEQNPVAGARAKHGRTIYVIQNARYRRPIVLPELRDLSLRQAETTIRVLGLQIEEIIYEPSIYKNIVLDIRQDDTPIVGGTRLEEGSSITLVVGKGKGTKQVAIPTITGKSLEEARSWLLTNSLSLGSVEYDIEPTDETKDQYIVYQQIPESGTVVVEGTTVNIKLSVDIEKAIHQTSQDTSEEDFF
jgi:beta-lactam-binding protein with PASTA domain